MNPVRPQRRRGLALAAPLAAAIAGAAGAAAADGWTIFGSISQAFEADSNLTLDPNKDDDAVGSTTSLGVDIGSENSRSSLTISPGVTARAYTGSSSSSNNPVEISPRLATRFSHRGAAADLTGGVTFDMRPTEFSELSDEVLGAPDLNVINRDSNQLTLNGDLTAGYDIDSRNRFTIGPYAKLLRYTKDGGSLSPSTTIGLRSGFTHELNSRYGLQAGLGGRRVETTGANRSESYLLDLDGGVRVRVSERFNLNGNIGLTFVHSKDDFGVTDDRIGLTTNIDASYALQEDLSLTFRAKRGIEPSALGELQNRTVLSTGLRYLINQRESVDLGLGYSSQSDATDLLGGSGSDSQLRADIGYSIALTPDVSARIGYTARWVPSGQNEAMSHKLQLSISRNFALQP